MIANNIPSSGDLAVNDQPALPVGISPKLLHK